MDRMGVLSEDGRQRLWRRTQRLMLQHGEGYRIAARLWAHVKAVEWREHWLQKDLESSRSYASERLERELHLERRCTELYNLLTPKQRAEQLRRDRAA